MEYILEILILRHDVNLGGLRINSRVEIKFKNNYYNASVILEFILLHSHLEILIKKWAKVSVKWDF